MRLAEVVSRGAAGLLLPWLLACAVQGPTASLLDERAPRRARKPTLAVMPIADARPQVQRTGKVPRLVPLLIWYQRVGRYVTGDASFDEPVAPAVTRRLMTALAGVHFGEAEIASAPDGARDPLVAICELHSYEYVARSELQSLYATLFQRAYFVFPTSLLDGGRNHTTPARGRARLRVAVHACADRRLVFERTLSGAYDGGQLSLAPAAARALEIALAQLAHELELFPPP